MNALLSETCYVITANKRLASYLQNNPQKLKTEVGNKKIEILFLNDWLMQCWQAGGAKEKILTEPQLLSLWQLIITTPTDFSVDGSFPLQNVVTAAKKAWELVAEYMINWTNLTPVSIETQYFLQWIKHYQQHCREKGWTSLAEALNQLPKKLVHLPLPSCIYFAGFDHIPPALETIIHFLQDKTEVRYFFPTVEPQRLQRLGLSNVEEEAETMARFANAQWKANPTARIGCIVPHLTQHRALIIRAFRQQFGTAIPYNIAGGEPVARFPLIHAALGALSLLQKPMFEVQTLSQFLLSPYFYGGTQEHLARTALDYAIRTIAVKAVSPHQVTALARQSDANHFCPKLVNQLNKLLKMKVDTSFPPSRWVHYFKECLTAVGWPGDLSLNNEEYQLLASWNRLLEEFRCFDMIHAEMSCSQALAHLQGLADAFLFQTETVGDKPIQILGSLESVGFEFDVVWVMGLDEINWPLLASANPFLPISLQRQHGLPHASIQTEMQFAKHLTKRFAQSGKYVLFSYSNQYNNQPCSASTLIREYPEIDKSELQLVPFESTYDFLFNHRATLEHVMDDQAPPVLPEEKLRGGTAILQKQAHCPFQAYAKIRLNAQTLPEATQGLTPAERGSIIHAVLSTLWSQLKTQEQLLSLSEEQEETLITNAIESSFREFIPLKSLLLNTHYRNIEKQCLALQIKNWLALEKKRPTFKVIATEQAEKVKIGALEMEIRIDRIDELENGDYLIIDYKTGKAQIKEWETPRPSQPQLPIYCVTQQRPVVGIALGQIRPDEVKLLGISAKDTHIKQIEKKNDWDEIKLAWEKELLALSNAFSQGTATISPKEPSTCTYCDLQVLCRINASYDT